jgi:hypothetical protein
MITDGRLLCLSVRLFLRMQQRDSYRTDFRKISYFKFLRMFVEIPFRRKTEEEQIFRYNKLTFIETYRCEWLLKVR